jgi:hypothetical protein
VSRDGTKEKVTTLSAINDPNTHLFEEVFKNIEAELPPLPEFFGSGYKAAPQKIPNNPLCVITTLYEDEHGNIRPIVTDKDRRWIAEQEKVRRNTKFYGS